MDSLFNSDFNFSKYLSQIKKSEPIKYLGYVTSVNGLEIISKGPCAKIGEICTIVLPDGSKLLSEVVGLNDVMVKLTAFGDTQGIEVGCQVIGSGDVLQVPVGMSFQNLYFSLQYKYNKKFPNNKIFENFFIIIL